ncbi:transcription antitermination factor NusB [bacterium]|jgi:N utilization substance protein B|nr:transcription antitermination factor NusB [Gemmatimonadota bacterium]MBE85303.1 transcription antitermination factor NusB [Gemmatimonadota bacterium]MCH2662754.1 transcription antitermination factor NusB [bacterium]HCK12312.1 transcription antitermination factor NusB [Candidatus Latescibacterota bacterium]
MSSRREAREAVLQAIYWAMSTDDPASQTLKTMTVRSNLSREAAEYAIKVGKLMWANREQLDEEIGRAAENWEVSRISRIDRILMWMALTEIRSVEDVPVKVSIDEAIELAKRYSVEKAPGFINGILDKLAKANLEENRAAEEV